jgi:tetratricopeptide (TPR) repeat protein
MNILHRFIILIVCSIVSACSGIQSASDLKPQSDAITADTGGHIAPREIVKPLATESLYELLVGDFALARDQFKTAQSNYISQAHKTLDPHIIDLAANIAIFNQDYKALEELALLWIKVEPTNPIPQSLAFNALGMQENATGALTHACWLYAHNNQLDLFIAITAIPDNRQDTQQLIKALEQLKPGQQLKPAILLALAILYRDLDDHATSQQIIEEFLTTMPMNPLGILLLSEIYQQTDRLQQSLQLLATALNQKPGNHQLRQQYAQYLALVDRAQAIEQFELLREQQVNNQNSNFMLALLMLDIGELKKASALLVEASQDPSLYLEAQYYLGTIADTLGNSELAIDFYRQVQSGEKYLISTSRLASLIAQQTGIAGSRDYLQSQQIAKPDQLIELLIIEANLLIKNDQRKLAYQLLTESLIQFPDHPQLLYTRAIVAEQLDNYRQTELDLRKLIANDTENAIALNALGYSMLIHTDRHDEAYKLIKQAYFLNPGDAATIDSLGWALFLMGQPEAALKHLKKAMAIMPDPEIAAHLGEVQWVLGNREAAIKTWQNSLEQSPKYRLILETIDRLGVPIEKTNSGQQ